MPFRNIVRASVRRRRRSSDSVHILSSLRLRLTVLLAMPG